MSAEFLSYFFWTVAFICCLWALFVACRHLQKKVSDVFVETPTINPQHATPFTQQRLPRRGILVTEFEYHCQANRGRNAPYTVSVISIEPPVRPNSNDGLPSYDEVVTQSRPPIVANK